MINVDPTMQIVYKLTGEEKKSELKEVRTSLIIIEARAPGSRVLIVGTNLDQVDGKLALGPLIKAKTYFNCSKIDFQLSTQIK